MRAAPEMIDALTPEAVAEALGCEVQHVNELAAAQKLPAVKFGRSWRFPVAALNQYLARRALEHVEAKPPTMRAVRTAKGASRPLPDLTKTVSVG
jgi:excisionase family DNA binding protein